MSKIQAAIQSTKRLRQQQGNDRPDNVEHPKHAANIDEADPGNRISVDTLKHVDLDTEVLESNRILTQDNTQRHPVQGAYRMLRTRLMQSMRTNQWKVLAEREREKAEPVVSLSCHYPVDWVRRAPA